jgi:hypothetical protein
MGTIQIDGSTPKLTIGNATAEDATILFDGNAQDFYIALDDSADDLLIGLGSTVGTTPMLSFTEAKAASFAGAVTMASTLDVTTVATAATFEPDGDTASGDNAAIGYTSAEGLILTGQGSTSDVTVKNDADTTVFTIPTGTDDILFPDNAKAMWGAGSDLQIYHDASNSYIKDNATGSLILEYSEIIFNESGADADFRVEGSGNANLFKIDAGANLVGIGSAPDQGEASASLHIKRSDSGATVNSNGDNLIIEGASTDVGMSFFTHTGGACNIMFGDSGDNDIGRIVYEHSSDFMGFTTNGSERMRIASAGNVFIAKTSNDLGAAGVELLATGQSNFIMDGGIVMNINRETDDGNLVQLLQDNALHGTIAVSGSTVSYNAFCGSHWSRLADNSKPTILRGTVMESIATMVDWYQAEFDIGGGKMRNEPITLDGRAVGDTFTHTWTNSQEEPKETFTATIVKEDNEQLPKCKISDTADSKAVYGVFMNWDDNDDGTTGVNDMSIASLGAFVVRVHKDETVAIGNWLVSKGDGTAKVLAGSTAITADVQSSLIGKVTSTTKTHIHADDSYCVPCTLHCG